MMSIRKDSIRFTNSRKKRGKTKERMKEGWKERVIFADMENRGKGSPLPRAAPELQRYRATSGDDKYLSVTSLRSDGKPLGSQRPCLYKPAAETAARCSA
jgi:hypothetical protein